MANLALFHRVEGIPATGATESLHYLFSLSALLEGRGHTLVDQLLSRIQLLPLTQSAIQVRVVNAGVETKRHHFGVTVDATRLSAQVLFRIRPNRFTRPSASALSADTLLTSLSTAWRNSATSLIT